jgi:hypothetical protein
MSDARIEVGWNVAITGDMRIQFTESLGGGLTTVTISGGTFCHSDISSLVAGYDDFAGQTKSQMDGASPNGLTYTVTWSEAAQAYTIAVSSGTVSLTFPVTDNGVRMRRVLGFSGSQSTAASHTSDQQPWYARHLAHAPTDVSDEYEPGGAAEDVEGPSGAAVGLFWEGWPTYWDFTMRYEPREVVHTHLAASAEIWCWDALVKHCRNKEPFLLRADWANDGAGENTVHFVRAPARFVASASHADSEQLYDIPFETRYKGDI